MGTKAREQFDNTSARSIQLAGMHAQLKQTQAFPPETVDDVMRAAVALCVASMDAYFTRRFVEVLIPYLKKNGPNDRLASLLGDAGLDTAEALRLAAMDRPFRRIRSLVAAHLATYTTQRFNRIDELFLCFGVKNLCGHSQGWLGRKRLLRSVELLVERRHAIVHSGDRDKHGNLRPVDDSKLMKRMEDLVKFVHSADALIAKAIKI